MPRGQFQAEIWQEFIKPHPTETSGESTSSSGDQPAVAAETYTITGKEVLISTARQSLARLMTLNAQKEKPGIFRQPSRAI
jgi:hypothetical protein